MRSLVRIAIIITASFLAALWLLPLGSTFLTALKSPKEAAHEPFWSLPSRIALFENIRFAWDTGRLSSGFMSSVVYAAIGASGAVLLASAAAYALAHLRPPGSFSLFLLIYSGTLFPFQMYLVPLYKFYQNVGLYDSRLGLLLFYVTISIPFCLFVLRNYFTTIPREIVEAAKLDGLSNFGVYWRMYLPLSLAPIATLFVFQFTWIWNDLLFGITLAKSTETRPIMAGLASLRGIYSGQNIPGVLAGALIASAPTIAIFLALQRYFIRGLTLTTRGE